MAKYRVLKSYCVGGGKDVDVGDEVVLSDDRPGRAAAALKISLGFLELIPEEPKPAVEPDADDDLDEEDDDLDDDLDEEDDDLDDGEDAKHPETGAPETVSDRDPKSAGKKVTTKKTGQGPKRK